MRCAARFSLADFWLGRWLSVTLTCLFLVARGDTLFVTNTNNSGVGSLAWAITNANANPSFKAINFQIAGPPPYKISPVTPLPPINISMVIDATTQPGHITTPIVELNGASAPANAVGLQVASSTSFCTVRGLVINSFKGNGIELDGPSNTVVGNYIGTDVSGNVAQGNGTAGAAYGIYVKGAGNQIGGTNAADRNVISGNNDAGILFYGAGGNIAQGNWIGVTAANSATALGNAGHGIVIFSSAGNVIGGTNAGAGNVISGNIINGSSGIFSSQGSTGNWIQGNHIGTDVTGSITVSNAGDGITLFSSSGNSVGPSNILSGNGFAGVSIQGAANNLIIGNFIGTDGTGNLALPNRTVGISVVGSSGNQIGGSNLGAGNVISGNAFNGIQLINGSALTTGTTIQGNLIGVNAGGTSALRNGYQGIILNGAVSNLIGGTVAGARNIISGNASNGVFIASLTDTNNILQGNYIGTDVTGLKAVANGLDGVHLQASANSVGGPAAGARNIISGNAGNGVFIVGTGGNVRGNVIQGNYIGLDATGNNNLANNSGVGISDAATNLIGGTLAGDGNVISGNISYGIFLTVASNTGNQIQGNYIGTDATGTLARGNGTAGIYSQNAGAILIGGSTFGAGNVISGNGGPAYYGGLYLTASSGNVIQGNFIGTKSDGISALSNTGPNIDLESGSINNIIGGTNAGAANRIAFAYDAARSGVRVRNGAYNNLISGNSTFSNGQLGIDLGSFGSNPNVDCESGTSSASANYGQNYPVLTNVISGANTRIRGYLDSTINKTYRLQFFASAALNASGYAEGQVFLGEQSFSLGGNCTGNFSVTLPAAVPAGWFITATATDPANNTSEFSAGVLAAVVPPLNFSAAGPGQQTLAWTNNGVAFNLQQAFSLNPPVTWLAVPGVPALNGGNYSTTVTTTNQSGFYRLLAP